MTLRYPGVADADESEWQELVVRHLGLRDWHRMEVGEELDFLGPVATETLRRHGLLWPPNLYLHVPLIRMVAGGTLLTGIDGDVLFGGWRWKAPGPRTSWRTRLSRRYLSHRGYDLLPLQARAAVARRWLPRPAWVRPEAEHRVACFQAANWSLEPARWSQRVAWWWRHRYLSCLSWGMSRLGGQENVTVVQPLLDRAFVTALGSDGGARGYGDRTAVMRALFSDLLPEAILARTDKAFLDGAVWRARAREFAADWDGGGVDGTLVDIARLRAEWSRPLPHFGSASLLHAAWLAQH